jgi:hypothetical protein
MPTRVERKCENKQCGKSFTARFADVKRGWARFCSKSCKAVKQEQRTGQYAALLRGSFSHREEEIDYEGGGWDAHKNY